MTMKKRTVAAIAATTLGLTLVGVGAASAAGDNAPEWAPQMGQHQVFGNGAGNGLGTGDPTTCPYYDGTGDMVQERTREHAQDQNRVKDQAQLQDRTADQTQQRDRAQLHKVG